MASPSYPADKQTDPFMEQQRKMDPNTSEYEALEQKRLQGELDRNDYERWCELDDLLSERYQIGYLTRYESPERKKAEIDRGWKFIQKEQESKRRKHEEQEHISREGTGHRNR